MTYWMSTNYSCCKINENLTFSEKFVLRAHLKSSRNQLKLPPLSSLGHIFTLLATTNSIPPPPPPFP